MVRLLRGRMSRAAYATLLHNLRAIYAALEPALVRHKSHPALVGLDLPALARSTALEQDLATLGGATGAPVAASTVRYVERLAGLDSGRPELLLAHAYVRYLGDLSGGQLLSGIVARSPELAGVGTAFYDFGDAATANALADGFRAGLVAAEVDAEDAVVEEAKRAFEWHRELFDELAVLAGIAANDEPPGRDGV